MRHLACHTAGVASLAICELAPSSPLLLALHSTRMKCQMQARSNVEKAIPHLHRGEAVILRAKCVTA